MSTPTRDEFVAQVIEIVQKRFPLMNILPSDDDFAVRIKLSPSLYAEAQKLANHQASDPIEENGEFHVLLMDKRQAPPERSFAEARDAVLQDFKKDEQTRVENANLSYLKSKADVQLSPEFRQ